MLKEGILYNIINKRITKKKIFYGLLSLIIIIYWVRRPHGDFPSRNV